MLTKAIRRELRALGQGILIVTAVMVVLAGGYTALANEYVGHGLHQLILWTLARCVLRCLLIASAGIIGLRLVSMLAGRGATTTYFLVATALGFTGAVWVGTVLLPLNMRLNMGVFELACLVGSVAACVPTYALLRWTRRSPRCRIAFCAAGTVGRSRAVQVCAALVVLGTPSLASLNGHHLSARLGAKKNVILITVDTWRASHLGCYGYPRATSPNLDRFTAESTLFENAIAPAPSTTPSIASILTGLYPKHHGVRILYSPMDPRHVTLAEVLRNAGYRTAAFVSNYVLKPAWSGLDKGFDVYDARFPDRESNRDIYERRAQRTADDALAWLQKNHNQRFFLWVHFQDPHGPYVVHSQHQVVDHPLAKHLIPADNILPYVREASIPVVDGLVDLNRYVNRYDAELRYTDAHLGRIFDALETLGLYDRSLVVVTADHGEAFGEHEEYCTHSMNPSHATTHVPLILRDPELPGERRIRSQVGLIDVMPTILEAVGIETHGAIDGVSLLPRITSGDQTDDAYHFIEVINDVKAIRGNGWKYIEYYHYRKRPPQLFDVSNDPGETVNLARTHPEMAAQMRERLHAWMTDADRSDLASLEETRIDGESRRILQGLGYVGQ